CRKKKIKCDRTLNCQQCARGRTTCVWAEGSAPNAPRYDASGTPVILDDAVVVSPPRDRSDSPGAVSVSATCATWIGKKRIRLSCEPCRVKKRKCDKALPCGHCAKMGTECVWASNSLANFSHDTLTTTNITPETNPHLVIPPPSVVTATPFHAPPRTNLPRPLPPRPLSSSGGPPPLDPRYTFQNSSVAAGYNNAAAGSSAAAAAGSFGKFMPLTTQYAMQRSVEYERERERERELRELREREHREYLSGARRNSIPLSTMMRQVEQDGNATRNVWAENLRLKHVCDLCRVYRNVNCDQSEQCQSCTDSGKTCSWSGEERPLHPKRTSPSPQRSYHSLNSSTKRDLHSLYGPAGPRHIDYTDERDGRGPPPPHHRQHHSRNSSPALSESLSTNSSTPPSPHSYTDSLPMHLSKSTSSTHGASSTSNSAAAAGGPRDARRILLNDSPAAVSSTTFDDANPFALFAANEEPTVEPPRPPLASSGMMSGTEQAAAAAGWVVNMSNFLLKKKKPEGVGESEEETQGPPAKKAKVGNPAEMEVVTWLVEGKA
ncbi:hypothetical protein MNV49_004137, partial [Pseudohyphozyma bogoriensis]